MKKIFAASTLLAVSAVVACGPVGTSADEVGADPQAAYGTPVLDATHIWRVKTTDVLNCRLNPGTSSPVVFSLRRGIALDVVDSSRPLASGYTWIHVNPRGDIDHNDCWVAADDRFIEPANFVDIDNYPAGDLYGASELTTKTVLNCRKDPLTTAPLVYFNMPVGTHLAVRNTDEFHLAWNNDMWWLLVDRMGDGSPTLCWVAAKKSYVSLSLAP